MAETYKNLGTPANPGAVLTDLYTVPASTSTVVSSVVVCNRTTSNGTFRISHAKGGAVDGVTQYLYFDTVVYANQTYIATLGITMATTDVLRVYGSANTITFNAYGCEIT